MKTSGLFVRMLEPAREMGLRKPGTIALNGTKIHANASRPDVGSVVELQAKAHRARP